MKPSALLLSRHALAATLLVAASCKSTPAPAPQIYPAAPMVDQVDEYHGVEVADPYRWMEGDPDEPQLAAWIAAENELTRDYLDAIPEREAILERLTELWNVERISTPFKLGERVFYRRNDGLQDQAVLFVVDTEGGEPRELLDPNTLSEDGTIALSEVVPSPDGELIAYSLSDGGSDWREWRFMKVADGEKLPDVVLWNKFGGLDWVDGSRAVVYTRFPTPAEGDELREKNLPASISMHVLGTDQEADVVVAPPPAEEGISQWFQVTDDGKTVLALREQVKTDRAEIDSISISGSSFQAQKLIEGYDAQYQYVGNVGSNHLFRTNLDAPRWRVIAVDPWNRARNGWREVIPQSPETMEGVNLVGGHLVASYLKDASSEVRIFSTRGLLIREVDLPGLGTARGFGGEADDPVTFYSFANQITPGRTYRYNVATGETELFHDPKVLFDPADYEVKQVFYTSKDGTRIPMFLSYKKGLELDGNNRTYLYGYGGFNISITPYFRTANLAWMEMGGVLAMPNIRGGGEYGEVWHKTGTKLQKQNVFDDFIAAAEWLIENDYTNSGKLAIGGGSNGGLLVGACMIQRPELFGAAYPAVGVMDMLRYHEFTIGWAWAGDYGTSKDPEEFKALLAYSPLHCLSDGVAYPATLVTTADRDDRVVPAHSFKFAARLQAAHAGDAPVLIRINTRAGHGAGKPTTMQIAETADQLAFFVHVL